MLYQFIDLFIIYISSIITFILFGWDKHLAVFHRSRIPELILLIFSFLGGAFGALCGMIFFNHKTQHNQFVITVPICLAIQLAIVIVCRTLLTY